MGINYEHIRAQHETDEAAAKALASDVREIARSYLSTYKTVTKVLPGKGFAEDSHEVYAKAFKDAVEKTATAIKASRGEVSNQRIRDVVGNNFILYLGRNKGSVQDKDSFIASEEEECRRFMAASAILSLHDRTGTKETNVGNLAHAMSYLDEIGHLLIDNEHYREQLSGHPCYISNKSQLYSRFCEYAMEAKDAARNGVGVFKIQEVLKTLGSRGPQEGNPFLNLYDYVADAESVLLSKDETVQRESNSWRVVSLPYAQEPKFSRKVTTATRENPNGFAERAARTLPKGGKIPRTHEYHEARKYAGGVGPADRPSSKILNESVSHTRSSARTAGRQPEKPSARKAQYRHS